jgi:26S proteasome regulatory subunit T1
LKTHQEKVKELIGIKESDTGLSLPSQWDLVSDKQMMQEEQPLQVARCTKIINPNQADTRYMINIRQIAKFVVGLGEKVSPTDIDEGMRVGVDRTKYAIQIPLPPKIDPTVSLMEVEDKPDVTYDDVGGSKKALEVQFLLSLSISLVLPLIIIVTFSHFLGLFLLLLVSFFPLSGFLVSRRSRISLHLPPQ